MKNFTVRDLLFADDAALVAHSAQDLMSQFSSVCSDLCLNISLKKIKVLCQETDIPPSLDSKDIENVRKMCKLWLKYWTHRLIVALVMLQTLSLD